MAKVIMEGLPFDSKKTVDSSTGEVAYDRPSYSKQLAQWWASYFSDGILVQGTATMTNELQVIYLSAMNCVVKPGSILIAGRSGFLDKEQTITFDVGGANPRIDRVVAELNLTDRRFYIDILKGAESGSPVPPNISQTVDKYQIPLAQVRINAGQATIASVTDERKNYISNMKLNLAPSQDIQSGIVKISEAARVLYGLSVDDQNVDKALIKVYNKTVSDLNSAYQKANGDFDTVHYITYTQNWNPPKTGYADVYLVAGGGGGKGGYSGDYGGQAGGGGGGNCLFIPNWYFTTGVVVPVTIGAGGNGGLGGKPGPGTFGTSGQDTSFAGKYTVKGGGAGQAGNGGEGGSGGSGGNDPGGFNGSGVSGVISILTKRVDACLQGYCPLDKKFYGSGGGGTARNGAWTPGGGSSAGNGGTQSAQGGHGTANTGGGGGAGGGGVGSAASWGGDAGNGGSGVIVVRFKNY